MFKKVLNLYSYKLCFKNRYALKRTYILGSLIILVTFFSQMCIVTAQGNFNDNNSVSNELDSNSINVTKIKVVTPKTNRTFKDNLVCPGTANTDPARFPFLALPCDTHSTCQRFLGSSQRCCKVSQTNRKRCIKGVPRPKPEVPHQNWLGQLRQCPRVKKNNGGRADSYGNEPFAEIFNNQVRECTQDSECWPMRICCPDAISESNTEPVSYCRAPAPNFEAFPSTAFREPLQNMLSYFQCTPPPPPFLDLFPKPCRNSFDCFPNLCCQEQGGKRFCRPPKRSVLALIAGFTQRLGASYRERYLASQKPSVGLE